MKRRAFLKAAAGAIAAAAVAPMLPAPEMITFIEEWTPAGVTYSITPVSEYPLPRSPLSWAYIDPLTVYPVYRDGELREIRLT